MKTLLSLVLSGVAIVALSGCGGSGGSDDTTAPVDVATKIVGTWALACHEFVPGNYETETLIFNADGSGSSSGTEYNVAGCNPQSVTDAWDEALTYRVGAVVKAADGADATELDVTIVGGNENVYTAIRIDANNLLIANDEDGSGKSQETRSNNFLGSAPLVKQ